MEKPRHAVALMIVLLAGCAVTPPPFEPPAEIPAAESASWKAGCDSGLHVASFGRIGTWSPPRGGVWTRAYVTCRDRFVLLEAARRN